MQPQRARSNNPSLKDYTQFSVVATGCWQLLGSSTGSCQLWLLAVGSCWGRLLAVVGVVYWQLLGSSTGSCWSRLLLVLQFIFSEGLLSKPTDYINGQLALGSF